jgi:hypothetical protein
MSSPIYWSLLGACAILVGLYSRPAWGVVQAGGLPVAESVGKNSVRIVEVTSRDGYTTFSGPAASVVETLAAVERRP